jgi:hypothetical protein
MHQGGQAGAEETDAEAESDAGVLQIALIPGARVGQKIAVERGAHAGVSL